MPETGDSRPVPGVSVIVPVRNGEAFLARALESVLAQDPAPLEVIVVDDGSTDESAVVAERFGGIVRVVRQAGEGPSAARNRGLREARGEVIAFLDADDFWPPGKLAAQLAALERNPGAGIALGPIQCVTAAGADAGARWEPHGPAWTWCLLGAALVRREVFGAAGALDPARHLCEDLEWFLRALDAGVRVAKSEGLALIYRIHGANMTRGIPHAGLGLTRVLKETLDRRRKAGRISVIVPAYNAGRYLERALRSLLAQTERPREILLVDDGSTDDTAAIARRFPQVTYSYQPNQGASAARNAGLRAAKGDLVAFLDADDLWPPGRLALQRRLLDTNPDAEVAVGRVQPFRAALPRPGTPPIPPGGPGIPDIPPLLPERDTPLPERDTHSSPCLEPPEGTGPAGGVKVPSQPLSGLGTDEAMAPFGPPACLLNLGSALFRRRVFDRVGPLDEGLDIVHDWDWFLRARELGVSILSHPEVTLLYRRHESGLTRRLATLEKEMLLLFKRSLDRRRRGGLPAANLPPVGEFLAEARRGLMACLADPIGGEP